MHNMPNKIYRNMLEGEIKTLHSKGEVGRILAHKMLESERASKKYIFSKYANDELGRKKLIQELFKHKHYKEILANEEYKKLLTYDMCFEIIKHDSNASIIIRDMKLFELTKDQQKMLIELCLKEQIDQLKTDKDLRNWRESGYVYMPLMGVESINKAVSNLERYTLSHIRHNYEDPKIQIAKLAAA
jgi:hypothetical protein